MLLHQIEQRVAVVLGPLDLDFKGKKPGGVSEGHSDAHWVRVWVLHQHGEAGPVGGSEHRQHLLPSLLKVRSALWEGCYSRYTCYSWALRGSMCSSCSVCSRGWRVRNPIT